MNEAQIRRLVESEASRIADERIRAALAGREDLSMDAVNARLKSTRHENSDHLERALLVSKLKPSTTDGYVVGTSGTNTEWMPRTGIATGVYSAVTDTGNASVTGLGFAPKIILVFGSRDSGTNISTCIGYMDADSQASVSVGTQGGTTNNRQRRNNSAMFELETGGGSVFKSFTSVSLDADGFTFNRATNDGTAYGMYWVAIG